ncbi:MAG: GNAT family N-acetyltransferase [Thermoanaerobaculales bacterium]|jgi:RimJ/RimL family protein N-acetyltransferase|nr:GNAT family N-acetyltransferase [Thermoanaerobaculales bacterium]
MDAAFNDRRVAPRVDKTVKLKDGQEVLIRNMRPTDVEASFEFFSELPREDRRYLRTDVTHRELVERRTTEVDSGRADRLVAVAGSEVVADGTLELKGHGWGDAIGEIRLIVARPYQHLGLGTLLARELYYLAMQHKLDRIVVRVMRPQKRAHRIMQRLGFTEEFLLPEHVRDQNGEWQDLIVMRCNLDKLWNEMESLVEASDWRWHR